MKQNETEALINNRLILNDYLFFIHGMNYALPVAVNLTGKTGRLIQYIIGFDY